MANSLFAPLQRHKSTSGMEEFTTKFDRQASPNTIKLPWLPSPTATPPITPALSPRGATDRPSMLVMKFGGTSLAGVEHLRRVAEIVRDHLPKRPVLVLSAMGKTTNSLLDCAEAALKTGTADISKVRDSHEAIFKEAGLPVPEAVTQLLSDLLRIIQGIALLQEVSARTRDLVVSFGERLSVRTFEAIYNQEAGKADGVKAARALDSWDLGMETTSGSGSADSSFSQVEVLTSAYLNIQSYLSSLESDYSYVPVVTGYIAKDANGVITTLGRDGSDLTATIIGAAVSASEVQIWKDVSGIMTIDPKLVASARRIEVLTYEEAAELSMFGAKVVHPAAVMPAWMARVPVSVRSSLEPKQPGTRIVAELGEEEKRESRVAAMSSKRGITMIVIKSTRMLGQHGFLAHVFRLFDQFEVSVDVIATSEVTISLTLDRGFKSVDVPKLIKELQAVARVELIDNLAMLTLITGKRDSCAVLKEAFATFEELGVTVEMVSHGASNVNVTFVISADSLSTCAQKLHEAFFRG